MSLKAATTNSTCFRKSEHVDKVIGTISPFMNAESLTYLKNATKFLHDKNGQTKLYELEHLDASALRNFLLNSLRHMDLFAFRIDQC